MPCPNGVIRRQGVQASSFFAYSSGFCWGTLRKTLFIRKNADGSRDLSVFLLEFDHQREEDGKYVFKALTRPLLLFKADTTVHLMSSIEEKRQAVALVEGAVFPCNASIRSKENW